MIFPLNYFEVLNDKMPKKTVNANLHGFTWIIFYMDSHLSNTYTLMRNLVATYVIQWNKPTLH